MAKCVYKDCFRLSSGGHDDCAACRQRYKYWDRKTPAERLERQRKLRLSSSTMEQFVTEKALKSHNIKLYKKELKASKADV